MVETQPFPSERTTAFTLDIGGEGRHQAAWNLNPSPVKTKGADRGSLIPRLILGRAELIPLPDKSVDRLIVERTPLRRRALEEIRRVATPTGLVILRHAVPLDIDPHRLAVQVLDGCTQQRTVHIDGQRVQETVFLNDQRTPTNDETTIAVARASCDGPNVERNEMQI